MKNKQRIEKDSKPLPVGKLITEPQRAFNKLKAYLCYFAVKCEDFPISFFQGNLLVFRLEKLWQYNRSAREKNENQNSVFEDAQLISCFKERIIEKPKTTLCGKN